MSLVEPERRLHAPAVLLLLVLLTLACGGEAGPDDGTGRAAGDTSRLGEAGDSAGRADGPVCLRAAQFAAYGPVPLDPTGSGGADHVSALRHAQHEGCERIVIDLALENDRPAVAAGDVRVRVLRDLGVVRVSLRDVPHVDPDATDAAFDGRLARAAYAIWSADGRWIDVDIHLAAPAEAAAGVLANPARVVLDLRPGGGPLPPPPATSRRVVVLAPRPGPARYPLTVSGYARTFEANVVARLVQRPNHSQESFTTATAWVDGWGAYSLTIEAGPTGPIELHVGEYSAEDGEWEGVMVELQMR